MRKERDLRVHEEKAADDDEQGEPRECKLGEDSCKGDGDWIQQRCDGNRDLLHILKRGTTQLVLQRSGDVANESTGFVQVSSQLIWEKQEGEDSESHV